LESIQTDASGRNFEAERYRYLFRESQEELARQKEEYVALVKHSQERLDSLSAFYESHISELHRQSSTGEGSSSGRRG
jgi:cystathionine beta-lyase family protein involved in aluminum resistance